MSGRKKSVTRKKLGGRQKPDTVTPARRAPIGRRKQKNHAGGVLTDGPRTPRERSEVIKTQALSVAKELSELGNDPEWYEDVKTDIQTGRWIEASLSIEGYAESFMDPIMNEKGQAMAKKIADYVGQNKSYSNLEVGWRTDNQAYRIAQKVEAAINNITHLKYPSLAYQRARIQQTNIVLESLANAKGLRKQRLARVAAHLEDENLHNEAEYIRDVLVGRMDHTVYMKRLEEEWLK